MDSQSSRSEEPFLTLPIQMPSLPAFPRSAIHEIRLRRNTPKIPTETDLRTLFLKNIPADGTEAHLRAVFAGLVGPGRFQAAFFEDGPRALPVVDPAQAERVEEMAEMSRKRKRRDDGNDDDEDTVEAKRRKEAEAANLPEIWDRRVHRSGSSAVALLADEKSVQVVLKAVSKLSKSKKYPVWEEGLSGDTPSLGLPWITSHLRRSYVGLDAAGPTRAAVRALFDIFNRREREANELARRLRNEPDEDGFVTVTRNSGARNAPASRGAAELARQKMQEKTAKRKDELGGFYRFQLREQRKKEQQALLKNFEEDRQRVKAMRDKRGSFRPET